jgi:hypothetical protein
MKYKFHELKGKPIPEDANEPVKRMLIEELKCPEAVEELTELERRKACGGVDIIFGEIPKTVKIKTNWGMVEGYDLIKHRVVERKFIIISYKHIKNVNIDFRKEKNGPERNVSET